MLRSLHLMSHLLPWKCIVNMLAFMESVVHGIFFFLFIYI